jgi:hypothetical protein
MGWFCSTPHGPFVQAVTGAPLHAPLPPTMMLAPAEAQPSGAGPDPSRRTGGRGVSDVAASRRVVAFDALTGDDARRHDGRC